MFTKALLLIEVSPRAFHPAIFEQIIFLPLSPFFLFDAQGRRQRHDTLSMAEATTEFELALKFVRSIELSYPDGQLLECFLQDSADPVQAARYMLQRCFVEGRGLDLESFMSDWKQLINMCTSTRFRVRSSYTNYNQLPTKARPTNFMTKPLLPTSSQETGEGVASPD